MRKGIFFKGLNDLKFGLFIGRFPSDSAASMAVKGVNNKCSDYQLWYLNVLSTA